jgi:glyoxylase-like metal-dependent hydrolase (beta-lactamase superfamily II)
MRKVMAYLLGFVLVCLVAALAYTAPAHWQINRIAPELPDWAALDAALNVDDGPVAVAMINTASQTSTFGEIGHPSIVINWPDGRRFLLDTGMPPDAAQAFGKPMEQYLGADRIKTYGALATQLGAAVDSVKGVAFTHLHSDHTAGLPGVCGAQQLPAAVYQAPLQREELNYTTKMGMKSLDAAACPREVLVDGVIKTVPGFPGLLAVSMGGHTPGSTLYAIRIDGQTWLFSGDITNDRRSILENLPKPWWYSTLVVPEDTERTAQLREWLRGLDERPGVTVLPAHDTLAMAAAGLPAWSPTAN